MLVNHTYQTVSLDYSTLPPNYCLTSHLPSVSVEIIIYSSVMASADVQLCMLTCHGFGVNMAGQPDLAMTQ